MRIISREEWGARYSAGFAPAPLPAKELYLHHTVTRPNDGFGAIRQLDDIGQSRFGGGVSYTFIITPNGAVYEGHGINRRGAHTGGRNSIARAIAWVGDYDTNRPPRTMVDSTIELVRYGHERGWWPNKLTGGHRDAPGANTACPGRYAYMLIDDMNKAISSGPAIIDTTGVDNMFETHKIPAGKGALRLILPVGNTSSVLARAWISAVLNGGEGFVTIWFQTDSGGISETTMELLYQNGHSRRVWAELPNGTTQMNIHYDFPEGGTITLEGLSK